MTLMAHDMLADRKKAQQTYSVMETLDENNKNLYFSIQKSQGRILPSFHLRSIKYTLHI